MTSAALAAEGAGDARFTLDFRAADGTWKQGPLMSCLGVRFEDVPPVRPFRFGKGLRSFAGWWYFATTDSHVGFESWLERDHLMLMDFDPEVAAVASQPFWLHWRDGAGRSRRHAPDLFARMADGSGLVIDVRPDDRIEDKDAEAFAAARPRAAWPGGASGAQGSLIRC